MWLKVKKNSILDHFLISRPTSLLACNESKSVKFLLFTVDLNKRIFIITVKSLYIFSENDKSKNHEISTSLNSNIYCSIQNI